MAIEGKAADIVVIGMDANAVADPNHDIQWECYDPATCRSNLERYSEVSLLFNAWRDVGDLSDTWKRHHQEVRGYTRLPQAPIQVAKRIDYILINQGYENI